MPADQAGSAIERPAALRCATPQTFTAQLIPRARWRAGLALVVVIAGLHAVAEVAVAAFFIVFASPKWPTEAIVLAHLARPAIGRSTALRGAAF